MDLLFWVFNETARIVAHEEVRADNPRVAGFSKTVSLATVVAGHHSIDLIYRQLEGEHPDAIGPVVDGRGHERCWGAERRLIRFEVCQIDGIHLPRIAA